MSFNKKSFFVGAIVAYSSLVLGLYVNTKPQAVHERLPGIPKFADTLNNNIVVPETIGAVVILSNPKSTIKNFCSGSVISNQYILTAAHCLSKENAPMIKDPIDILNEKGDKFSVGVAVAKNDRFDLGLLQGKFNQFKKIPLANRFIPDIKDLFVACGYPAGQPGLVCETLLNVAPYEFKYSAFGQYVPGMSGGPVLEVDSITGELKGIVGVNYAASAEIQGRGPANVEFSPILGILGLFDIY